MHHQEYIKQLPKVRSPKQSTSLQLNKKKSFFIFNPQLLSLNTTQFQIDIAKDNVIHLKNELLYQQQQLGMLTVQKELIRSQVFSNAHIIQTILMLNSKLNQQNLMNPLNEDQLPEENSLQCSSLLLPSKQINFINSLEQHNTALKNQIQAKNYELKSLENTEKVSRYTQLHLNYNSNNAQLNDLKKNYELLKLQYDELQYRLNKTIDQCNHYKESISRYKLQSLQYNIKQKEFIKSRSNKSILITSASGFSPSIFNLKSPKQNKSLIMRSNNYDDFPNAQRDKKQTSDWKNNINKLNYRIEDMNKQRTKAENKKGYIMNQMNKIDSNIDDVKMTIEHFENDLKQFENKTKATFNDLDDDIVLLNNDIDISKQVLIDLNETMAKQNKEINVCEKNANKIECDLNKEKDGNRGLAEIINENKKIIENLQGRDEENDVVIGRLEKEYNKLKDNEK